MGKRLPRRQSKRNEYQTLEQRIVLTGVTLETFNNFPTIIINGSADADSATAEIVSNDQIRVTLNGQQTNFARNAVQRIRFLGRSGDDSFINNTDISSAAYGHGGNDFLQGGSGNNWIQGGEGNDHIVGGDRNDNLRGRAGDDYINPGRRHDRVFGGPGNDTVAGSHGDDFIKGEDGNDILRGGDGEDKIMGGNGNDTIDGGDQNDLLRGENGDDTVHGRLGHDRISGGAGNDELFGNPGWDEIFGDQGNDEIHGNEGEDMLSGGDGTDSIAGGPQTDSINFGSGNNEIAIFGGNFSDYSINTAETSLVLTARNNPSDADQLTNAETLRFNNVDRQASDFNVNYSAAETESLRLLNQLRASRNLTPLTPVRDLSNFAESWSQNTLPNDFRHATESEIQHLFVDGRTFYGENIVFLGDASLSSEAIAHRFHEAWVNSPTHFSNMIGTRWTEIGIGIVRLSSGWYGTHSFGNI